MIAQESRLRHQGYPQPQLFGNSRLSVAANPHANGLSSSYQNNIFMNDSQQDDRSAAAYYPRSNTLA